MKKKWEDLNSAVKKRSSEIKGAKKRGGGSPSIIVDAFEEKVLSVIGDTA